ncbi:DNA adenine methylase [Sodalis ligni]|uniref:site-specific DNA-methyltransferase (adenine-specific) n=1 Tax=Sodalis ligni TaxID=2697027 RepID=A0A4R1NGH7_9GAMM|nr:DNA adenine methylase [Sodalis ligni]TCL03806.1 DNA adenine methylase [Sodalis ligni]
MRFYTPLRYPGGKGKLSYYIKSLIEVNSLSDGYYIEPYAGGAAVAMDLLINEYVRNILINDVDPAVYSFWHSVLNHTDALCEMIEKCTVDMDTWYEQKDIINRISENSPLLIGFATFFLNRTNRSGILKAGVIGGKTQSGDWKMDVRFKKDDLISRIRKIASYKNRIKTTNYDASTLLLSTSELIGNTNKLLIYLDPPYYVKGQDLYRNYYEHDDHVIVKKTLEKSGISNWIVSYDNADEIKSIYTEYRKTEYSLSYTAQSKKIGEEVMIFSNSLILPTLTLGKEV